MRMRDARQRSSLIARSVGRCRDVLFRGRFAFEVAVATERSRRAAARDATPRDGSSEGVYGGAHGRGLPPTVPVHQEDWFGGGTLCRVDFVSPTSHMRFVPTGTMGTPIFCAALCEAWASADMRWK